MTSNRELLSFDGNRYGGLPKRFTRKVSVVPNYLTNLSVKKDRFRIFMS